MTRGQARRAAPRRALVAVRALVVRPVGYARRLGARVSRLIAWLLRPVAWLRRLLGVPLDALGHIGSVVWRSLFGTASAFSLIGGFLYAIGRQDDSYAVVLIAGALGAVATGFGLLALRVEPDTDVYDPGPER